MSYKGITTFCDLPEMSKCYNPKVNEYITMLNILHTAFNLDIEEYKNILNLINSNDDANIEIAGAMLRNLHRNYNITKKTDNEIRESTS